MPTEQQNTQCPAFGFKFTGHCPNGNCIYHSVTHADAKFNCLKIDSKVVTALDYTTAKSSKLLMQLAKSDDPKVQLDASRSMLHFAFLFGYNLQHFEKESRLLCKCGAWANSCDSDGTCQRRQQWFEWLIKLFQPLLSLNGTLTKREVFNLLMKSLVMFPKHVKLPALLHDNLADLHLSKRIL